MVPIFDVYNPCLYTVNIKFSLVLITDLHDPYFYTIDGRFSYVPATDPGIPFKCNTLDIFIIVPFVVSSVPFYPANGVIVSFNLASRVKTIFNHSIDERNPFSLAHLMIYSLWDCPLAKLIHFPEEFSVIKPLVRCSESLELFISFILFLFCLALLAEIHTLLG